MMVKTMRTHHDDDEDDDDDVGDVTSVSNLRFGQNITDMTPSSSRQADERGPSHRWREHPGHSQGTW